MSIGQWQLVKGGSLGKTAACHCAVIEGDKIYVPIFRSWKAEAKAGELLHPASYTLQVYDADIPYIASAYTVSFQHAGFLALPGRKATSSAWS